MVDALSASNLPSLAAIQLNSNDSLTDNLAASYHQLLRAKHKGACCVVLPENFAWMGSEQNATSITELANEDKVRAFLAHSAKELGLWIIGGSHRFLVNNDKKNRVSNTTLVFNPYGQQVASYDKIHLFDAEVNDGSAYHESATFKAGASLTVVDMGFARVGLSICYDLRFPEMFQALRRLGADIIAVPAAFTVPTGQAHWQALLQARAIENQVYMIAAAQWGQHSNGRETWGHSLCLDPWGEIIAEKPQGVGNIYCQYDAQKLNNIRFQMPVIEHHCPKAYQ